MDIPNINPNLCDENGRTALHVANWFNKVNIFISKTNLTGETALQDGGINILGKILCTNENPVNISCLICCSKKDIFSCSYILRFV